MSSHPEFGGVLLSSLQLHRISITETAYAADSTLAEHRHSKPFFCFVGRGLFEETTGRATARYTAGELIFRPAGERHRDRFLDLGVCLNIEIPSALTGALNAGPIARPEVLRIARRLHREFRRPGANPLVVEGLTLQVIGQTAELSSHRGRGRWLKQVVERIESDYASPLTISALADAAGVHPVHLARTFKNEYGVGVRTYLESLRVARAREMLRAGEDSLATVAGSVGFCDQSHLTRAFKRATGLTPGQFRRRNS